MLRVRAAPGQGHVTFSDSEGLCCVRQQCWIERFLPVQFYPYSALGKLFVPCPFSVKLLCGLVVFPLDEFPSLAYRAVTWAVAVDVSVWGSSGSSHCPTKK